MSIERVKLIRKLQQDMCNFVYAHQKKKIAERMYGYAIENQNLLNCNSNTFIYNNTWYSAGDPVIENGDYKPNRLLHTKLKEQIVLLLAQEFEAVVQQSTLQTHFGQVLLTANHKSDLLELLPYPLHSMINVVDSTTFDYGSALTSAEIEQFKIDNHDGITCLNSMLLLELLLSK